MQTTLSEDYASFKIETLKNSLLKRSVELYQNIRCSENSIRTSKKIY